jgi:hypothetical protein
MQGYRANHPKELNFNKGDFFYVLRDVDIGGEPWYEAHNTINGSRGLVPKPLFEEFKKPQQKYARYLDRRAPVKEPMLTVFIAQQPFIGHCGPRRTVTGLIGWPSTGDRAPSDILRYRSV